MSLAHFAAARFEDARILVVGDLMLDRFRYGSVSRISPEAPVPVLHIVREQKMLGGAGNVLANITSLGGRAGLIAAIGADDAGRLCSELIAGKGGDAALLVESPTRPTTLKTRFISGSQQSIQVAIPISSQPATSPIRRSGRSKNRRSTFSPGQTAKAG